MKDPQNQLALFEEPGQLTEIPKSRARVLAKVEKEKGAAFACERAKHFDLVIPFTNEIKACFDTYGSSCPNLRLKIINAQKSINKHCGIKSVNSAKSAIQIAARNLCMLINIETGRECRESHVSKDEMDRRVKESLNHVSASIGVDPKAKK